MATIKTTQALPGLLDQVGICFREDHSCCQTCGLHEIQDFRKDHHKGFAFFHRQDSESASESGLLRISFGAFNNKKKTSERIASLVVKCAIEIGLEASWSGSTAQRITVCNVDRNYYKAFINQGGNDIDGEVEEDEEEEEDIDNAANEEAAPNNTSIAIASVNEEP